MKMKKKDLEKPSSEDCLRISQMFYCYCNDRKKYTEFIREIIDKPNAIPNEVHRLMLSFHPASFLTTNYDHLLENASIKYGQSYKSVVTDEEVASINGDRFILKVHGDIEHDNFVLNEGDYLAYEENFKLIPSLMRSVFSTNTVVFIGYSIGDYNVKLLLDGVRRVLKDKLELIFIRCDDKPLTYKERKYYESRGLKVIEYGRIATSEERARIGKKDYEAKYSLVLNYISTVTKEKLLGNTDEDSFANLYHRLLPLDKLTALRISDIQNRLSECCAINNMGIVYPQKGKERIFQKFITIHELKDNEKKSISEGDRQKYRLIRRVLNKGRVYGIEHNHKIIEFFDKRTSFADDRCIMFNYSEMVTYCKEEYKSIIAKSKKAFYLTRLRKYEEAFDEYLEIAKESFKNRDYVQFYLAEINLITLKAVLKNPLICFNKEKILHKKEENLILWETENDLFDSLPQEFKKEYKSLRDLCTKEFLYKYGFYASADAVKLEKSLNAHTIEVGETSSVRVISRVNEYLHFLLGNGVSLDVFDEYRLSVSTLMEKLIQKYTDQQRKTLREPSLFAKTESPIMFDQYDFYCFVRFFDASDLKKILENHNCKTIMFNNMESVEYAIHNLLIYAAKMIKEANTLIELEGLLYELKTCLTLANYMSLSEKLVEEICRFVLKNDLRDITIDQKVMFLYSQVYNRHIINESIQRILEDALIDYLDKRLTAIKEGRNWDSFSKNPRIGYPNIADYMNVDEKKRISRRLSKRVSVIIDKQIVPLQKEAVEHYVKYISKEQKNRLSKWIENMLAENFDFERFVLLMQINTRKAKALSDKLYSFLVLLEKETEKKERVVVEVYPKNDPHEELRSVGYLCMCGLLDPKRFMSLKGIDLEFDFWIDPINFDYSKFELRWLMRMTRNAFITIKKRTTVKKLLMQVIIQEIKKAEIKQEEREKLVRILGDYFAD